MIRWYLFRGTIGGKPVVWARGPTGSPLLLRGQRFAGRTFEDLRTLAKSPGYVEGFEQCPKPTRLKPKPSQPSPQQGSDESLDWKLR